MGRSPRRLLRELHFGGIVMKLMPQKSFCLFILMILFAVSVQGASYGQQSSSKPEKVKESSSSASEEQDAQTQLLKDRALSLLESLADLKGIEDKVESAHMKADFADLMCACGEKEKAIEIFKKSLTEITSKLLEKSGQNNGTARERYELAAQVRERFDLVIRIAEQATDCNPTFKKWAANEIEKFQAPEKEKSQNQLDNEPPVIPDEIWGTKPSIKRQLMAGIFYRLGNQKLNEEKFEEASSLFEQSLKICVDSSVMNALSRLKLKGRTDIVKSLYLQAAHKVQSLPSGSELYALNGGLGTVLERRMGQAIPLDTNDALKSSMINAYLDAISALLQDQNAALTDQSSSVLSLIKEALPLYYQLRPATKIKIEQWVADASKRLSPSEQSAVEKIPFATESAEPFVSRIQEIATKTVDANERDQAYAAIASKHIDHWKFDLASQAIAKIADLTLKQELSDVALSRKTFVDLRKDADLYVAKERIEKIASLPMRVKGYLQLGKMAFKKDPPLTKDCLEEAARLCEKIGTSPVQAHLLLAVAKEFAEFDSTRSFEILRDAIHSINKTTEPPIKRWGKPLISFTVTTSGKFPRTLYEHPSQYQKPYDFSLFKQLALVDFEGTLLSASNINDKTVRASTEFEICTGILLKGKPTKNRDNSIPPPQ
jgi:tetratricopeptide (TPR) repeat protein